MVNIGILSTPKQHRVEHSLRKSFFTVEINHVFVFNITIQNSTIREWSALVTCDILPTPKQYVVKTWLLLFICECTVRSGNEELRLFGAHKTSTKRSKQGTSHKIEWTIWNTTERTVRLDILHILISNALIAVHNFVRLDLVVHGVLVCNPICYGFLVCSFFSWSKYIHLAFIRNARPYTFSSFGFVLINNMYAPFPVCFLHSKIVFFPLTI